MPTKMLMTTAAVLQALCGIVLLFAPDVIVDGPAAAPAGALVAQQMGTALLGLAVINTMARASVLGGIYGRPVVAGNLTFFLADALLMLGRVLEGDAAPQHGLHLAAAALFAAAFARVLLGPVRPQAATG